MGRKEMTGRSKHRHRPNNRRLAEQYNYVGEAQLDTTLRLTSYNAYHVRSDVIQPDKLSSKKLYADAEMHWLEVCGLSDSAVIMQIVKEFGFDSLDAKDILTPQHVAKVEIRSDRTLIVLNVCYYNERMELQKEHVGLLLTHNVVISFVERNDYKLFDGVHQAIANNLLDIRSHSIKQLLLHLLNALTSCLAEAASMAEELLEDYAGNLDGKTLGILTETDESEAAVNRRQGFCDVLQETGVRILWDVAGSFGLEEQRSLEELPGADLVAALDDVSLTSAGQCAAANDLHGAVVYGIGTSTEAVYYLDTGNVECLVVPDEFNVGYQSLAEVAASLQHHFRKVRNRTADFTVIRREELFSEENQELLFTMSQ